MSKNTYTFIAYYDDGTQYEQGLEDISLQDVTKNAFYDIHYKPIKPPDSLYAFRLVGTGNTIAVNLRTGMFEVNGFSFFQHTEPLKDFRLIYYRVVKQMRDVRKDGTTKDRCEVGYILGWQTTHKRKNIERVIKIEGV